MAKDTKERGVPASKEAASIHGRPLNCLVAGLTHHLMIRTDEKHKLLIPSCSTVFSTKSWNPKNSSRTVTRELVGAKIRYTNGRGVEIAVRKRGPHARSLQERPWQPLNSNLLFCIFNGCVGATLFSSPDEGDRHFFLATTTLWKMLIFVVMRRAQPAAGSEGVD